MSIRSKTKAGRIHEVSAEYTPAVLPTPGRGLECGTPSPDLETFVPGAFRMSLPDVTRNLYAAVEDEFSGIIAIADRHSSGEECDGYIDGQIAKVYADLKSEMPEVEIQAKRIIATREARMDTLKRRITTIDEVIERLEAVIKPLEDLRSQFVLRMGITVSLGMLITIGAMVFDALVNNAYYQTILLSNAAMLWITVIGCSLLSDASMMCLGMYISRKDENFTSKPLYYTICVSLFLLFLVSVISSVMVRFGSMPETFGTIDADGNAVAPESYSLAQWGVTLVTAFVTACTGVLSFAFSNDKNAHLVSIREHTKRELAVRNREREPYKNELLLLENAVDPMTWYQKKLEAVNLQIRAQQLDLKLHVRKLFALHVGEADFLEKMAKSSKELLEEAPPDVVGALNTLPIHSTHTMSLDKAC